MPDSLTFDAVDDERTFSVGSYVGTGAVSTAVIIKPGDAAGSYNWIFTSAAGSPFVGLVGLAGDEATVFYNATTERFYDVTKVVLGEWWLIGVTKAAGTTTPRAHLYRYSTTTWTHANMSGTMASGTTFTSLAFGIKTSERTKGDLLIAGVWDSDLGASAFETEQLHLNKDKWTAAAPKEAWRFDTTSTITPFVGTGTQTGSVGATLASGSAPAGWTDAAAAAPTLAQAFAPIPFMR